MDHTASVDGSVSILAKIRTTMTSEEMEILAGVRAAVGLLGEKEQHDWWSCAFFSKSAATFLVPLFPRTQYLSRINAVTAAAALLHDDRIGVGQVFHLFRLPEDMEQSLHRIASDEPTALRLSQNLSSAELALQFLSDFGSRGVKSAAGPVRVGDFEAIRTLEPWKKVAAVYAQAFGSQHQSFPYFAEQN
jgi:hypothetical protein